MSEIDMSSDNQKDRASLLSDFERNKLENLRGSNTSGETRWKSDAIRPEPIDINHSISDTSRR